MPHDLLDLVLVGACWLAVVACVVCWCVVAARADREAAAKLTEQLGRRRP